MLVAQSLMANGRTGDDDAVTSRFQASGCECSGFALDQGAIQVGTFNSYLLLEKERVVIAATFKMDEKCFPTAMQHSSGDRKIGPIISCFGS